MKKVLMMLFLIAELFGADHDLYDRSIALTTHYSFNDYDMDIKDSGGWGFRYTSNKSTENFWEVGGYQLSFDYTSEADYISVPNAKSNIYRFGGNLLWYFDNDSQFTPFALVGAGIEIFGDAKRDLDNGIFGTVGGGVEYQLRGDLSFLAEGKWFYGGEEEESLVTSFGLKYSFGQ
jgi:OOP family OmpA-OmpF porin